MTNEIPQRDIDAFGRFLVTPGSNDSFERMFIFDCWLRHVNNDWGELDPDDAEMNAEAVRNMDGSRVMSVYKDDKGTTLWIITSGLGNDPGDPDMCNTVALLPSEY